jgi:putative hemolysin
LEGLILLALLEGIRSDYRIVANGILSSVPALRERLLFVNPFGDRAHVQENCSGLRASMEWVQAGGLLILFPAGEVSHLNFGERPITDPKWNTTAARIARKLSPVTVPLFFEGVNSRKFQLMGAIHPRLRTLNLCKRAGQQVEPDRLDSRRYTHSRGRPRKLSERRGRN